MYNLPSFSLAVVVKSRRLEKVCTKSFGPFGPEGLRAHFYLAYAIDVCARCIRKMIWLEVGFEPAISDLESDVLSTRPN